MADFFTIRVADPEEAGHPGTKPKINKPLKVDWGGIEPPTSAMPGQHSTTELPAQPLNETPAGFLNVS